MRGAVLIRCPGTTRERRVGGLPLNLTALSEKDVIPERLQGWFFGTTHNRLQNFNPCSRFSARDVMSPIVVFSFSSAERHFTYRHFASAPSSHGAYTQLFREGKGGAPGDNPQGEISGGTAGGSHLSSIANGRLTPLGHRRPPEFFAKFGYDYASDCDRTLWTHFLLSSFHSTASHLRVLCARYLDIDYVGGRCDDDVFNAVVALYVYFA